MTRIILICFFLLVCFTASTSLYGQETGDVNEDGVVNIVDALMIAQFYVGLIDPSALNITLADVNGDGGIDIVDALLVTQYDVGLRTSFP